jgi:hypothetical protein
MKRDYILLLKLAFHNSGYLHVFRVKLNREIKGKEIKDILSTKTR